MLIFITGGSHQGKTEFARTLGLPIVDELHLMIGQWLSEKKDLTKAIDQLLSSRLPEDRSSDDQFPDDRFPEDRPVDDQYPDDRLPDDQYPGNPFPSNRPSDDRQRLKVDPGLVVICNEVGCGIIPSEKNEREYREAVGRIACCIAKKADVVYRVEAGIASRIKG